VSFAVVVCFAEATDTNCMVLVFDEALGWCIVTSLPRIESVGSGNTANVEPGWSEPAGSSHGQYRLCRSCLPTSEFFLKIPTKDNLPSKKRRIVLQLSASGQRNSNNHGLREVVRSLSSTISSL
jgi:hypothetical protein